MTPDEASELAEFLDQCIEMREQGSEYGHTLGYGGWFFCPLGAAIGTQRPTAHCAAAELGLSVSDAHTFILGFDDGHETGTASLLGLRYRRIALGIDPRPWSTDTHEEPPADG